MKVFVFVVLAYFLGAVSSCGNAAEVKKNDKPETKEVQNNVETAKTILFFGNSLTAGYGLDPDESFPSLIQQKLDSASLNYKTVNAGVSGETSASGNARIDWILKQTVDVFVLELGANDGLRGLPVTQTQENLQAIINKVKAKYPDAVLVLAGMMVPPNMGANYANRFSAMFPALAKKNNMALVPFLLEGVGGVRALNQADGIHPTAEGQKILANNVWQVMKPLLR